MGLVIGGVIAIALGLLAIIDGGLESSALGGLVIVIVGAALLIGGLVRRGHGDDPQRD